jgi:3-oxoacyl-[acyl-carrier-protein] synthase-3
VQDALGAGRAGAFDLAAGCSGFVYALGVAAGLIRGGLCGNALVIGAEVTSRIIDWSDRGTCVLFGDGAGAVVLRGEDRPGGVLATTLGADGSGFRLLWVPAGGGRTPPSHETVDQRLHAIDMDGRSVYRFAVRAMPEATRAVLTKAGLSMADVSLLIPHQANQRIMDAAARSLDVPKERIYSNVARYGNTSAASIPIALCEAIEEGRIQQDDVFVCVGFGGGLTWAASAVQWSEELPAEQPSRLSHWFYQVRYVYAQVRSRVRRLWRRLLARWTKD